MQYQLNIVIDDTGLSYIYSSGQSVALVRTVTITPAFADIPTIVWVAFSPFEQNRVVWDDGYSLYFSKTTGQIEQITSTSYPAQTGIIYVFQNTGAISTVPSSGNAYIAENQVSDADNNLFGMQQPGLVNNIALTSKVNATPINYQQQLAFAPTDTLSIFISPDAQTGAPIAGIPDNALTVTLSDGLATVAFDNNTNTFILA